MPNDPLLAALEKLTALRSLDTVEAALLKTLGEIYPSIDSLYLLAWHDNELIEYGALHHGEFASDNGARLTPAHPLFDLQAQLHPNCSKAGMIGEYFIHPLSKVDTLTPSHALLVLHTPKISPAARKLIGSLIRIVENFSELLREKNRDRLTGLLNRHQLEEGIDQLLNRQMRSKGNTEQYWLAMMDIDHFKEVNDTFGHLFGDEVLLTVSQLMQGAFRNQDRLYRYGGEEFVVLLSEVDEDGALGALERFRQDVERYRFPQLGQVTLSIGYCALHAQGNAATALGQADQALYRAKNAGRNQVVRYEPNTTAPQEAPNSSIELF
ncbi:GGDEF domain-containing protein [Atopomonas sediminilitoris]|uniref:GGDEF domain-containing protein n=1 Tax=Atopomonas sediminilitoris TaxID=2919919 RepID=UPI001F4EA54D|nr:GGDEF domain-containing protein [Atopomonas sediminilitoris]MCJ8169322.1 GGDEF domain-containing protein [Atopomonas sediminilitoris]